MMIALDTNILVDLWANTEQGLRNAATLEEVQRRRHGLVICGAVYAELHALPGVTKLALDHQLTQLQIGIDAVTTTAIWEEVGRVHAAVSSRRRASGVQLLRRPLADHLIGAHAQHRASALLTHNGGDFKDFPALTILAV